MVKTEEKTNKKLTQKDYEKKVLDLAKEGLTAEKIGQRLKNNGIHPKDYEKKIKEILGKEYVDPELKNVQEKHEKIKIHYEKNKQDKRAKREKDRTFSHVRKIKKYLGLIKK